MIYKNSTAPVLLKKINLNVWSLKEEIAHVVMSKIDTTEEKELIKLLLDDYSHDRPALRLVKNEEEVEGEIEEQKENNNEEQVEPHENEDQKTAESKGEEEITQKILKLPREKVAKATTIMAEIYMDEIYFFSETPFLEGQSVVIKFCIPQQFIMNADVIYCQTYSSSNRVIGEGKLPYRICAKFSFLKNGERTLLRRFLHAIEPNLKSIKPTKQEPKNEETITEEMFESSETT